MLRRIGRLKLVDGRLEVKSAPGEDARVRIAYQTASEGKASEEDGVPGQNVD